MFPPVFLAQVANGAAMLGFGVAALATARLAGEAPERHRHAWRMAGLVFVACGASNLAQNAGGAVAIAGGPGSPAWDAFLVWSPGVNYGRGLAFYALAALLVALALRGRAAAPLPARVVVGVLAGCFAAGMAAGLAEGPQGKAHLANYALLNTALPWVMGSAVAMAVVANAVDRLLALAMAAAIAPLPLLTLWLTWLAGHFGRGAYASSLQMQVYYLFFSLVQLGVGLHRLRLARRGVAVPPLLPAPRAVTGGVGSGGRWG